MQYVRDINDNTGFSRVLVTHKGETIVWDLRHYDKQIGLTVETVFAAINGYFSILPEKRQAAIFEVYKEIREAIDSVVDHNALHSRLTNCVRDLYSQIIYEELVEWIRKHGNVFVPPTVKETFGELEISERNQDNCDYVSKTYLRRDYIELVDLAILLKPMLPVWAEYSRILEQVSQNTSFREYISMSLLATASTGDMRQEGKVVLDLLAVTRLRQYAEASAPNIRIVLSAVLSGLGSSEIPYWLMSVMIIRKLVLLDVSSATNNNIVSTLYHHITSVIKSMERKFSGHVKKKTDTTADDEEQKSYVEMYKIKQGISDGDLMVLSIYAENTLNMAQRVSPTVTHDMVLQLIHYNKDRILYQYMPTEGQMTLLQWVLAEAISPPAINNINKQSLTSCFIAAQAVLWSMGLHDLAILITAKEARDHNGALLGGVVSQARIPKQYVDKFAELYPHYQELGNKKERQTNVACIAVDKIAIDFVKCDWIHYVPRELSSEATHDVEGNVLIVPSDIRTHLSELIVRLQAKLEEKYATAT